jgi:ATP-binding cassette subfamily B protein
VPEVRRMHYWGRVLIDKMDAKEIRMFDIGDFILGRYLDKFRQFQSRHEKLRKEHWRNNVLLATVSAFGNVGAYAYIVMTALKGAISIGSISLYMSAVSQISNNLHALMWALGSLFEGNLFINNLFEFLELAPTMSLPEPKDALATPEKLQEGICFSQVSFQYPDNERKVLDEVSFTIPAGKTVALVGENGAGKTTIVKLLSRLYDPSSGEILIDGINLKALDLKNWRASIGVVFQDYCRFHMTGRENIGIGKVAYIDDMKRIERAADRGGAAPVIAKLVNGYDTMLGRWYQSEKENEDSADISGGEWQKIALSRAFMRSECDSNGNGNGNHTASGAQVLILDEPTSALDAQAEYDIFLRFHELTAGKTTLLISHRFSTVRMADIVLVLENGKIIEQGSHKELMQMNKEYARLYNLQADRYKDPA